MRLYVLAALAAATALQPVAAAQPVPAYDLAVQRAKIARIEMNPDTSFLSAEERDVVNLLIQAARLMSPIYLRQVSADNPATRAAIARSRRADRDRLLDMFDLHFGPWDTLAHNRPFWGSQPLPPGGGLYPADMTKEKLDAYLTPNRRRRSPVPIRS